MQDIHNLKVLCVNSTFTSRGQHLSSGFVNISLGTTSSCDFDFSQPSILNKNLLA